MEGENYPSVALSTSQDSRPSSPVVDALLKGVANPIAVHAVTRTIQRCVSPSIGNELQTKRRPRSLGRNGPLLVKVERDVLCGRAKSPTTTKREARARKLHRAAFDRFADGNEKLDASKLTRALQCAIGSKFTEAFLEGYLAAHFYAPRKSIFSWNDFQILVDALLHRRRKKKYANSADSAAFYPVVSPFEDLRRDQVAVEQYDYTNAPVVSEHPLENTDAQRLRSKWVDQAKKDNVAGKKLRDVLRRDYASKIGEWSDSFNSQMNFVARNIHRENSLAVKGERARRRKFATRRLKAERQKTRTRVNAILDQKFEEKRVAAGKLAINSRRAAHDIKTRNESMLQRVREKEAAAAR